MHSPLEHFEINYYTYLVFYYYDFSLTTATIYFFLMNFFLLLLFIIFYHYKVIPTKFQYIFENLVFFILNIFKQQVLSVRALKFFPFYLTIVLIIFFLNFTSLSSYNVFLTGHIMITLALSFIVFFGLIIIGFLNYDIYFLTLFYPKDVPIFLLAFLILIELLSFCIRPFSLSIRLFANMLAGHTLLGIFASFANYVIKKFTIFLIVPLIFCFLILILEFGVAIIQAYVFFILISIYLNDISELH